MKTCFTKLFEYYVIPSWFGTWFNAHFSTFEYIIFQWVHHIVFILTLDCLNIFVSQSVCHKEEWESGTQYVLLVTRYGSFEYIGFPFGLSHGGGGYSTFFEG